MYNAVFLSIFDQRDFVCNCYQSGTKFCPKRQDLSDVTSRSWVEIEEVEDLITDAYASGRHGN